MKTIDSERQKTDTILIADREKAAASLAAAIGKAEDHTDELVQQGRDEADQVAIDSRASTDLEFDDATNDSLRQERRRSDVAIKNERSRGDVALLDERMRTSVIDAKFLKEEHGLTDKNISEERVRTDSKFTAITSREEFLAIVSHDLKNPLGAATSCAGMLLEDPTYDGMGKDIRHWLEFIKRNVDTSLRLIADLLDMERVGEGKLQLNMANTSISSILRDSCESFTHAASSNSVLLRVIPAVTHGDVYCDRDRILQVLSNLLSNAIKFTPQGGSIVLSAQVNANEIQFSVSDNGPGIVPDKIDQIFQRFAQIRSNDRRGLGLGLYIAKMLVNAHLGQIWVESKVGLGSTFIFTLPVKDKATS